MLKKIVAVGGIVAVTGLGIGGAALAQSNAAPLPAAAAQDAAAPAVTGVSTSASPTTEHGHAARALNAGRRGELLRTLKRVSHAQWVSKDPKTGGFVTHDAVRGTVTAVSSGSISIKATDGTAETFIVNSATKVHAMGDSKDHPGTISQVKVGDQAGVIGTGAGTMTATHIIDRGAPKVTPTTNSAPTT